ncbi:VIT1/CCC1 transporter family protein [Actinacidiphila oryziradicis]|uniref:VIT family protein n=1 Tax=Actinacidiphila oryziradicis TaxID=2571141 RepID=A0A4U0S0D0_9ACTN|nr:VIT family protein [Actinacidiphila oryziradicis]TKA01387.1 VIT family protein [Actinacidiphila oryziradicis]
MSDQSPASQDPGARSHSEPHHRDSGARLNWLRAGVLGANDGIVSTAGLVIGVAGATTSPQALLSAGLAGLLAGSLSMAAGEYVSVSSQRDSEQASLDLERRELAQDPREELAELAALYQGKGLSADLAVEVAEQLTAHDALGAHAESELRIDPGALTNPWHAAGASFRSFAIGALLPLLAMVLPPAALRLPTTVGSVLAALVLCGWISARLGAAPIRAAIVRNVAGGALAMAITYTAGTLLGHAAR